MQKYLLIKTKQNYNNTNKIYIKNLYIDINFLTTIWKMAIFY